MCSQAEGKKEDCCWDQRRQPSQAHWGSHSVCGAPVTCLSLAQKLHQMGSTSCSYGKKCYRGPAGVADVRSAALIANEMVQLLIGEDSHKAYRNLESNSEQSHTFCFVG